MDAYHGKWAFMPSSVLELLPNFKSTYFASMNPPIKGKSFFQYGGPKLLATNAFVGLLHHNEDKR